MQPSFKRIGVFGGFAVMLILLVGNALVTRRRVDVQTGIESLVSHTHEVLFELKQTELLLLTAEAGKRGYLYTGDVRYLFPYKDAIAHLEPQLDTVSKLTADNPRQQALIPGLRNLINEKVFEMGETIELYQSGKAEAARDLVLTDISRGTMDQISLTISQMESEEASLESSRVASYQSSVRRTIASIYLASLLATVGLVFLAYYILREIKLREKHALEIREREEWFRVALTSIGDAVIATDKEGSVAFLNPVAEHLTGYSFAESKGKNVVEVFPIFNERTHQPVENPVKKVLEKGHVVGRGYQIVLKRNDGTQIPIENSAAPIRNERGELLGVILVFRDATNERKATEIMRKTERLAAAARLTATMAHEINNPLQAVGSLIYLAKSLRCFVSRLQFSSSRWTR
jgi:PAS domain S-box-containing protein